jgi:nucleotide-binding universal stress UspA family protein
LREDDPAEFRHVAAALDVLDDHPVQRELDQKVAQAALATANAAVHLLYAMRPLSESIRISHSDTDSITPEQLAQWDTELTEKAFAQLEAARSQLLPQESQCHLLAGAPEDAIPEFIHAHGVDLLVMGTVARSGLDGYLIGNTADRILDQVDCAILALKPDAFVSPLADEA